MKCTQPVEYSLLSLIAGLGGHQIGAVLVVQVWTIASVRLQLSTARGVSRCLYI